MQVSRRLIPVTLVAIDTSDKAFLTERALNKCLEVAAFSDVKLLTHDMSLNHAVKIPRLQGLAGYSEFCIRHLTKFVKTSHCLLVQWDGYVLNPASWTKQFLDYDYIGAPWNQNVVGNGGFSLRSKRLLDACADSRFSKASAHPEDCFICRTHRKELEQGFGLKFAPVQLAQQFAIEAAKYELKNNTWVSDGRGWNGQFGFHSYLTPLPSETDRLHVFHHSGDLGDIIYSLSAIRASGGGVLYLSPDCRYPYPRLPKMVAGMSNETIDPISGFIEDQDYIWQCRYTMTLPKSTDVDFNAFREFYKTHRPENFASLFKLHNLAAGTDHPEDEPWLTVKETTSIQGKPIVVNRTPRYHNPQFPWRQLIQQYGTKMLFVGLESEYQAFKSINPSVKVEYKKTETVRELASVIDGAKMFLGNQSSPLAIALGLGKNVVVEEWGSNSNCRLKRRNAIYVKGDRLEIPDGWV